MAIQNDNTLVTKGDLKDLYSNKIAPYLGANLQMKTNVSDYYSTNEKIVGTWTDGKPLYQKTYLLMTPSNSNDTVIGTFDSTYTVREMNGFVEDSSSHTYLPIMFKYGDDANNYITVYITASGIRAKVANGYTSKPIYLTLRYTKTTDTASSAFTTPGCYDINFPNTWPENKEIYFGNGLYGYRATGTTGTGETQFVTGITINYLVSSDGVIYNGDWHIPPGNWATTDNYITRVVCNSSTGLVKMNHSSGYNSKSYDVWFTYIK